MSETKSIESETPAAVAGAAAGSAYPGVELIQLDNETKIQFCNAWNAMVRHYTVCKQCQVYLIEGDDDLCAVGKHLVAKELCYAECRVEIAPNDPS